MIDLRIRIEGHIIPKARATTGRYRGKATHYMPEKYENNQQVGRMMIRNAINRSGTPEGFPYKGEVFVDWIYYKFGGGDEDNIGGSLNEMLQGKVIKYVDDKGKRRKRPEGLVILNDCQVKGTRLRLIESCKKDEQRVDIRVYTKPDVEELVKGFYE